MTTKALTREDFLNTSLPNTGLGLRVDSYAYELEVWVWNTLRRLIASPTGYMNLGQEFAQQAARIRDDYVDDVHRTSVIRYWGELWWGDKAYDREVDRLFEFFIKYINLFKEG